MENELQGSQSAAHEARALYLMIGAGYDVEELRTLIAVPPKIKAALLAYAEADPRNAYWIEATLNLEVPSPGSAATIYLQAKALSGSSKLPFSTAVAQPGKSDMKSSHSACPACFLPNDLLTRPSRRKGLCCAL